jgi:hypothetical protein
LTKDFRAGGGRVGSPQPTDLSYLTNYFKYVDQNDNETRCDFAVTHAYWWVGGKSASSYASWFVNQCKSIYNNTGRPVWLTEMEISASWNKSGGDYLGGDWSYANVAKYVQALLQKIHDSFIICAASRGVQKGPAPFAFMPAGMKPVGPFFLTACASEKTLCTKRPCALWACGKRS